MEVIKILNEPKAKAKAKPKPKPRAKAKSKPKPYNKLNKEILNITKDKQIIANMKNTKKER